MHLLAFAGAIQLFPDGTIFIHIALVLIMIWVLNRTFFRPINNVIASRDKFHGGRNTEAESILNDAAQKESKYTQEMLAARSEGYELSAERRSKAVADRQARIAAAKAETGAKLAGEKDQLAKLTAEARAEIASEADKLAEQISTNILKTH